MPRKNGSKKIPNVILRPVPGPPREERRQFDALDEAPEFDPGVIISLSLSPISVALGGLMRLLRLERDGGGTEDVTKIDMQSGAHPFRGVTICCTGVPNKANQIRTLSVAPLLFTGTYYTI